MANCFFLKAIKECKYVSFHDCELVTMNNPLTHNQSPISEYMWKSVFGI